MALDPVGQSLDSLADKVSRRQREARSPLPTLQISRGQAAIAEEALLREAKRLEGVARRSRSRFVSGGYDRRAGTLRYVAAQMRRARFEPFADGGDAA